MTKFAFQLDALFGVGELHVGFCWGRGGVANAAVYTTGVTLATGVISKMWSQAPADIPDTIPILTGKRIFLDLMGSSITTAFVDVDLKIYDRGGTHPLYQAPTLSVPVIGTCTNSITINSHILKGGIVGDNGYRQFIAGMMNLLTPQDIPPSAAPQTNAAEQFCGYSRGARLRAIAGQCE